MKKNSITYFLILVLSGFFLQTFAQFDRSTSKVGTTAGQFLKIGAGARAIGMGNAYTALSNDIYAVYYNPAGITFASNSEVTFNHSEWLADINYDFAAGSINLEGFGTLFITITTLSVPEDKVRTFEFPDGDGRTWNANSISIGMGFARKLTENFSIGFQGKYIHEAIFNSSANGFAIDFGTYYITPFNDLIIGASISNFGSKMQLDGRDIEFNTDPNGDPNSGPNNILSNYDTDKFDLPLNFKLGLAMDIVKSRYVRITTALDAVHPNDNTEYINSGVEIAYDETFFIRGGYKSLFLRDSEQGLTLGAGLNYKFSNQLSIFINYAWADYGRLTNVQFIDVGLKF